MSRSRKRPRSAEDINKQLAEWLILKVIDPDEDSVRRLAEKNQIAEAQMAELTNFLRVAGRHCVFEIDYELAGFTRKQFVKQLTLLQ
jgi:hypothetical protein